MIRRMNNDELKDFMNQEIHPSQPFPTEREDQYPSYDYPTISNIVINYERRLFIKSMIITILSIGYLLLIFIDLYRY